MTEPGTVQVTFCFSILVVLFAAVVFYAEENVEVPHDEVSLTLPPQPPPSMVQARCLLVVFF